MRELREEAKRMQVKLPKKR